MTGEAAPPARWLTMALLALWLAGAALAHFVGVWMGIGSTAILLGTAVLMTGGGGRSAVLPRLRPSLPLVALGVAAGGVMIVATQVLFPLLVRIFPFLQSQTEELYVSLGPSTPRKLAVLMLVILGEELVWRGVVQAALGRRFGALGTVVLSALLYGVGHVPVGSLLLPVVALGCGLYWSALTQWSRSMVPALLAHVLWDLTVLFWAPLVART